MFLLDRHIMRPAWLFLKDGLLREMSVLFTKSLKRQPSREEIGVSS